MKPIVLVTRKLPDAVEERLQQDYDPILNPKDTLYSSDEIIQRAKGAEAILACHTSAALPNKPGMPWVSGRWTTWTHSSPR